MNNFHFLLSCARKSTRTILSQSSSSTFKNSSFPYKSIIPAISWPYELKVCILSISPVYKVYKLKTVVYLKWLCNRSNFEIFEVIPPPLKCCFSKFLFELMECFPNYQFQRLLTFLYKSFLFRSKNLSYDIRKGNPRHQWGWMFLIIYLVLLDGSPNYYPNSFNGPQPDEKYCHHVQSVRFAYAT